MSTAQCLLSVLLALASFGAVAAEFRSIGENAAILYDAPSVRGNKLFIVGRDLPVEIISTDGTWTKVRDSGGTLAWIERKSLADKRTLIVTAQPAAVHERAENNSPVVFQAQQGVLLDLVGSAGGWAQVRHADGSGGYVRINQVWGL
jgi:SH3-like domain-containing protein